jgi:hypothetical protein
VSRVCWKPILKQAALTMQSYDTGVTLRQLFYRLVAKVILPKHSDLLPATEQVRPWRLEDLYRRRPTSSRQRRKGGRLHLSLSAIGDLRSLVELLPRIGGVPTGGRVARPGKPIDVSAGLSMLRQRGIDVRDIEIMFRDPEIS